MKLHCIAVFIFGFSIAARASDIGGEVHPPLCPDVTTTVLCNTPMSISAPLGTNLLVDDSPIGDLSNPWVITEAIIGLNVDLRFAGTFQVVSTDYLWPRNPTDSGHEFGRYFSFRITNGTNRAWSGFSFELQKTLGVPSSDTDLTDSISFGQIQADPPLLAITPNSGTFSHVDFDATGRDAIQFTGGVLNPGAEAQFQFMISVDSPLNAEFYLRQAATEIPEPGTLTACMSALALALVLRRRQWAPARDRF